MNRWIVTLGAVTGLAFAGCGNAGGAAGEHHGHDHGDHAPSEGDHDDHGHDHGPGAHAESFGVTAWSSSYEIFAEIDGLVAGEDSRAFTHVTRLADFSPVLGGTVDIVLRDTAGEQSVGRAEGVLRDGIFDVDVRPAREGTFDLIFRIANAAGTEDVAGGQVRVGAPGHPGALTAASNGAGSAELVPFLKEEQWKIPFATAFAQTGDLHRVARGMGRVRPVAGGEVVLAAPMNAVVSAKPWPFVGETVLGGDRLFSLTPAVASERSLAELRAMEAEKRATLSVAEERFSRLESLLPVQAASRAEVESARADVTVLRAQWEAARSDLRTARAGRGGSAGGGASVPVLSPWAGRIAEVRVRPGQVIAAGESLGRMVRVRPYWVEAYLRPGDAARLRDGSAGLTLRGGGFDEAVVIAPEEVRLVSRAPEVNAATGTVTCVFEVAREADLLLGSAVEVEVTLPETLSGVIVPASAIVDDSGTPVVFSQADGENFARREVRVIARQGLDTLVEGVDGGERVVSRGGPVLRRATLISTSVGHGHVH